MEALVPVVRTVAGLAVSRLGAGLITAELMPATWALTLRELRRSDARAMVLDARHTLWAVTARDLDAMFDGADAASDLPAALVVSPAVAPVFQEHAWNMARRGFMRKVFWRIEPAHEWARLRMALDRPRTVP